MFILLSVLVGYRIFVLNELIDFEMDRNKKPLEISANLNKHQIVELYMHSFFCIGAIIVPERSFLMCLVNVPLVIRAWYLYRKKRLSFAPHQLVRETKNHQYTCFAYIAVYIISAIITLIRLFQTAIFRKKR